jgi:hypothetical protein
MLAIGRLKNSLIRLSFATSFFFEVDDAISIAPLTAQKYD